MPMDAKEIERLIKAAFPDAEVAIKDLAGDGDHYTARVVSSEDRSVTFQVEARDEHELIARGLHKRAVIRVESFARRVSGKAR